MKIELEGEVTNLILDDDQLDNDAFVDVSIAEVETTVSITDLMSAVIAFESKRSRRLSEEHSCDYKE